MNKNAATGLWFRLQSHPFGCPVVLMRLMKEAKGIRLTGWPSRRFVGPDRMSACSEESLRRASSRLRAQPMACVMQH
jgi:hypothetical protein